MALFTSCFYWIYDTKEINALQKRLQEERERPTPGTIFPALKSLRELNFISADEKEGKAIVYTLTERGRLAFQPSPSISNLYFDGL